LVDANHCQSKGALAHPQRWLSISICRISMWQMQWQCCQVDSNMIRCPCLQFLPLQFVRRLLNFRAPEDEFSSDDEPDSKLADELEEIGEDNGELAFLLLFDNVWKLHYVIRCLFCLIATCYPLPTVGLLLLPCR